MRTGRALLGIALASLVAAAALAAIDTVAPSQAVIGTTLDVAGSGFGTKPKAFLENQTTHKRYALKVTLPSDVSFKGTIGAGVLGLQDVVVKPNIKGAAEMRFSSVELVGPTITNVIPAKPEQGQDVVVACPNCGSKKGKVLIDGKPTTVRQWIAGEGKIVIRLSKKQKVGPSKMVVKNTLGQSAEYAFEVLALGASKGAFSANIAGAPWATVPLAATDQVWFERDDFGSVVQFHVFATHVGKEADKKQYGYTFDFYVTLLAAATFPVQSTAPVGGPQNTGVGTLNYRRDRTTIPFAQVAGANKPADGFQVTFDSFDGETLVGSFTGTIQDTNAQFADAPASGTFTAHPKP